MIKLKDFTYDELCGFVMSLGEKKFRAAQLFKRMYAGGAAGFEDFSELSKGLRNRLSETSALNAVTVSRKQLSKDGTAKYLFALEGGGAVEGVFMKYSYGNSACVSSQAGCRMGCRFCASGANGLDRSLSAGEIADQVIQMEIDAGDSVNHIVVMGTGEPFDNYSNVAKAIGILHDERGKNLSLRNITVSTCGILELFEKFARELPQVNLAVSLHAPDDETRKRIMPVANKYPMDRLLAGCRKYTKTTHRRITFEYALISGVNDAPEQAEKLAGRLRGMLCHVNLIPLNHTGAGGGAAFKGSTRRHAELFAGILAERGIETTVRRSLGTDISAACGQLVNSSVKEADKR